MNSWKRLTSVPVVVTAGIVLLASPAWASVSGGGSHGGSTTQASRRTWHSHRFDY
jgi:hypothetical protein